MGFNIFPPGFVCLLAVICYVSAQQIASWGPRCGSHLQSVLFQAMWILEEKRGQPHRVPGHCCDRLLKRSDLVRNFSLLSLALKPVPLPSSGPGDDLGQPMWLQWVSRCTGGFAEIQVLTPQQISLAFVIHDLITGWFWSVLPKPGFSKGLVWVLPARFRKRFSVSLLCFLFLC